MNRDSQKDVHTDVATPMSFETTHTAEMALAAMREARATAELACQAYEMSLPPEHRVWARTDRVPVIVVGPPKAALETAVAMLATCDAAAALALELSVAFADASQVAALTAAVVATSRSARAGVRALKMPRAGDLRIQLAHATALATHQVADTLILRSSDRDLRRIRRRNELAECRFPASWRDVITGLGEQLTHLEFDEHRDAELAGAAASHDAALHLVRVYEQFRVIGRADGAVRRYARIAGLAAAYAGWSTLERPDEISSAGVDRLPPVA